MTGSPRTQFPEDFGLADYFLFDRLEEGLGGKTAIRFGDREYTYDDIASRTRALAHYFASTGVAREERVYTVLPDLPAFAWSFFGTLAHGAVVAMGNPASPPDDLRYVLEYSRATVLITTPAVAEVLACAIVASPHLKSVLM